MLGFFLVGSNNILEFPLVAWQVVSAKKKSAT